MAQDQANVIQLKAKVTNSNDETSSERGNFNDDYKTVNISTADEQRNVGYTSADDLYPLRGKLNPILASAIRLIEEGIDNLNEAIKALSEDDLISSDDSLQKFQALLPELFCCREIGDGFGSMISSIHHAINNSTDDFLNEKQLKAIQKILRRIYSEPYISYDEAVDEIMILESEGFEVSPPHLQFFSGFLDEESHR